MNSNKQTNIYFLVQDIIVNLNITAMYSFWAFKMIELFLTVTH